MLAKEQRFIDRFAAHAAKAAQVQSRVKALEKIEKIELPKKRRVVKFDFRPPPRSGDQVAVLEGVRQGLRPARRPRRPEPDHPPRRALVRDGQERRRQDDAAEDGGRARCAPDAGDVRLGASLKMGYFAQQALDLLDPDLTIEEQLQKDFPHESIGVLRNLAGAFQFSGDDVDKKIRALSGGEKTRLVHGAHAARPAELPRPRRADQPPRPGDQGDADRGADGLRRHDAVRVARPRVPARPEQPRARAGRRERHRRAAAPLSRAPTSSTSRAPATRRPACTPERRTDAVQRLVIRNVQGPPRQVPCSTLPAADVTRSQKSPSVHDKLSTEMVRSVPGAA